MPVVAVGVCAINTIKANVNIQSQYTTTDTHFISKGKLKLIVHLLAPLLRREEDDAVRGLTLEARVNLFKQNKTGDRHNEKGGKKENLRP